MSTTLDQPEFLERLRARDRAALESVVTTYTGQIYKACLGLGFVASEAEDITQNTWVTFCDVITGFEGRSKLRTFLFGILYNKASEFRKARRRITPELDIEALVDRHFDQRGHWVDGPKDPEKFLHATQTAKLIADCMERLPIPQKMAFHLREFEGSLTDEICEILSVTASHLGVLLFRARNQLRECVETKI